MDALNEWCERLVVFEIGGEMALRTFALGVIAVAAWVGTALATPGAGIVSSEFIRATFNGLSVAHEAGRAGRPGSSRSDVVVATATIQPGGHTGWHSHHASNFEMVKSGTFTVYFGDDPTCTAQRFSAGQGFFTRGHEQAILGRNEGPVPVELVAVYTNVPVGSSIRIDQPRPGNCSF